MSVSLSKPVATHHSRKYTLSRGYSGVIHSLPVAAVVHAQFAPSTLYRYVRDYGAKLPTDYRITLRHRDGSTRDHKVWAVCYGNSASVFVRFEGKDCYLQTDTEYVLETVRDAHHEALNNN